MTTVIDDRLYRFLFEGTQVRGERVQLGESWRELSRRQDYPPVLRRVLGEAVAAVTLLAATVKLDGTVILQVHGAEEAPGRLLVVQYDTRNQSFRGLIRYDRTPADEARLPDVFGASGYLAITLDPEDAKDRYQGLVELGPSMAATVERYFDRSEQLPTRLWLTAGAERAAGLLLQVLPGTETDPDAWDRLQTLSDTVSDTELLDQSTPGLLHRLYHEENVRLFDPTVIQFHCGCSRVRIEEVVRSLGRVEAEALLQESGELAVDCEFCGQRYRVEPEDVARLFSTFNSPTDHSRH